MRWIQILSLVSVVCLSTAFNTRFILDEEPNNNTEEQTTANDNLTIEDETTPATNILAMIGKHLIDRLKNTPRGGGAQAVVDQINATVKEINMTIQVIKLTAEYINISAHYILSNINQYVNSVNDVNVLTEEMNTMNDKLIASLINHLNSSINEITSKAKEQVVTGEDMLFSMSYHLVTAFQDLISLVLNVTSKKPNAAIHEPNVEVNNKDTQTDFVLQKNKAPETVEVFSPVEIKSTKNQDLPLFYLTSWNDCNSAIKPVCAVDLKLKKYIIFLNECRRIAHNRLHGTNYTVYGMDVCTGLFLRNPGLSSPQSTPLI